MNRSSLFCSAGLRTRSSPGDTLARLGVRRVSVWRVFPLAPAPCSSQGQACMGLFVSSSFSSPLSRGRSRAAGRSPAAPQDRARQWLAASPPASTLRDCRVRRRARHGIRPVERSASLALLPNGWAAAGGAAPAPWVVGRSGGGAWRGVAPAARRRSAVPRVGDVWGCRPPIVNRDCHVSRMAVSVGFAASSLFGAGKAVLRPVACDPVPGARGRGQGTETRAALGGVPP